MARGARRSILSDVFRLRGSITLQALPPVLVLSIWALLVAFVNLHVDVIFRTPSTAIITLLGVVLGLLLTFRSNQGYDRFSEGRKTWASLTAQVRTMVRLLLIGFDQQSPEAMEVRHKAIRMICAFLVAAKHYLRAETDEERLVDLEEYADIIDLEPPPDSPPPSDVDEVADVDDPLLGSAKVMIYGGHEGLPFKIAYDLSQLYLDAGERKLMSNAGEVVKMVGGFVDAVTTMERIATSPIPPAYNIHLKQLLLIYCFFLPLQLVNQLGWVMILVVFVATYCLLGVEMIARQLEMPFGYDDNDLPMDSLVELVKKEIQSMEDVRL